MTTQPSEKSNMRIATFKIDADDYNRLEDAAREDDRSVSAVLRLAVRDYLDARGRAA